jgi:hypothetical protein
MKTQTHVKAGCSINHNQALARPTGLKVKTHVKAGLGGLNHSQTLVRGTRPATGLKVKTHVKAGGLSSNHNAILVRSATQKGQ